MKNTSDMISPISKEQKAFIIQELRKQGCRITKQRLLLLDVILEGNCASCKEIYYKASSMDQGIGPATVYRMIKLLEDSGIIDRKNLYRISYDNEGSNTDGCQIELQDHTICTVSSDHWKDVVAAGLKACGYINDDQQVQRIVMSNACA